MRFHSSQTPNHKIDRMPMSQRTVLSGGTPQGEAGAFSTYKIEVKNMELQCLFIIGREL